jgi:hypothetical protein
LALIVQVPAVRIVSVVPETEQMPDVAVVNATVKDDVDVAERDDGLVPKVISAGSVKVIVCVALVNVKLALALVVAS